MQKKSKISGTEAIYTARYKNALEFFKDYPEALKTIMLEMDKSFTEGLGIKHEVLIYLEGGNIQGVSATLPLTVTIYDKDDADGEDGEKYMEDNGTPEEWEKDIADRTAKEEIVGVY
jgi:hypothetical protein